MTLIFILKKHVVIFYASIDYSYVMKIVLKKRDKSKLYGGVLYLRRGNGTYEINLFYRAEVKIIKNFINRARHFSAFRQLFKLTI